MQLEQLLKQMEQPEAQEKVASETEGTKLAEALKQATAPAPVAAPAAPQQDAVADLMKMAAEMAGTEKEAEVAHAAMLGQAFADAAITKFAAYQAAAQQVDLEKSAGAVQAASTGQYSEEDMQKAAQYGYTQAQEDLATVEEAQEKLAAAAEVLAPEELEKFAAENGYTELLEKMASDYAEGYQEAMEEVKVAAATEFLKGAAEAEILINAWTAQQEQK